MALNHYTCLYRPCALINKGDTLEYRGAYSIYKDTLAISLCAKDILNILYSQLGYLLINSLYSKLV